MMTPVLELPHAVISATQNRRERVTVCAQVQEGSPHIVSSLGATVEPSEVIAARTSTEALPPAQIELKRPIDQWTVSLEKRYIQLVEAEAVSAISGEQMLELNRLQAVRRNLHHPPSTEEIVYEYRQQQVTETLISALHDYVTFFRPENSPRPAAEGEAHA